MVLYVSTIAIIVLLAALFLAWVFECKEFQIATLVVLAIVAVLGFGILGGAVPLGETTIEILMPDHVAKSEFMLFVNIEGKTLETTDARLVSSEITNIRVKKIKRHNSYGGCLESSYEIILAD